MTDRLSMSEYKRLTSQMSVAPGGRVVPVSKPTIAVTPIVRVTVDTPIILSLPYPVSANKNWRNGYVSKESRAYKKQVQQIAKQHCVKPLAGDVAVTYTLHPRQNVDGSASKARLDIFNAEKITSDALNGIAWSDDQQIVDGRVRLGSPKVDGGLTVEIAECAV